MKNLRKEFPIFSHNTYLNTASSGLLYDSLLNFRQEHDLDFLIGGSVFRNNQQEFLSGVRNTIADFFGGKEKDTVLTPNFSLSFNTLLNGIDKDKKILLLDDDYPSINFAVTNKGFDVCYAQIDTSLEQNIKNAITKHKPDVFAFSIVQYISGVLIDLDFLKELKSEYPDLLIIADATQFCGTTSFNFNASGIDILGCSGYKWLLGGYGNGFMLFKEGILEEITSYTYKKTALEADYDSSYTSLQARFECGHLDTFNFGSLQYSLNFLSGVGISTIEEKLNELCLYTKAELRKLDLLQAAAAERQKHSSIFNIKGNQTLFNTLLEHNIITSLRGSGIRISLHFYNTKEDIDNLLSILYRYR
ncbi:aminotransferase class V-fold PLP-dependent enzyme [Aquimarina sp. 2201CG5-10]|uniref:aminotransferase class V-fold PLP-dependent enzyme n=1 Tax=Aquimarina callyspongiae TaxID=3098150 RepID=UPI002AB4634D|nr:aminotransferase class V-fold PLP-dependent enzyme [Aquimarina sp. 2201CG5-10]MDY8136574.1 aminotransferase class V-fold PLP-dependent enzyme [Aquimarina sp. 2201CG5-10]